MYGMLLLLGAVIWLILAFGPLYMLWRRRKWIMGALIGLPIAAVVVAAPFWDYFIMLPAINEAYAKLAVNKVYKVSDSRKIRVRSWSNGVEIPELYVPYEEAIWAGKVDFIEATIYVQNDPKVTNSYAPKLAQFSKQHITTDDCKQNIYKNKLSTDKWYCIAVKTVEVSEAEVVIDSGTVHVFPRADYPRKWFEYSYWRATDVKTNTKVAEDVSNFIWDPNVCQFFNLCRYVLDDGPTAVGKVESAVTSIVTWKKDLNHE